MNLIIIGFLFTLLGVIRYFGWMIRGMAEMLIDDV